MRQMHQRNPGSLTLPAPAISSAQSVDRRTIGSPARGRSAVVDIDSSLV
jgi:hypothetical protein